MPLYLFPLQTSLCLKARGGLGREMAFGPENMGACEGGVSAESYFDGGREPAEMECGLATYGAGIGKEEGRFRQVHFACHVAHPFLIRRGREHAHCRRITRKRLRGESVDLDDSGGHSRITGVSPREA